MEPKPLPKPKLEAVDDVDITLVDLINPSIVLMDSRKSLKVLLSRNTRVEKDAIYLRGVRLIEIPLGWRLALIRMASHICKVRLPDELEFSELHVETANIPSPVLAGVDEVGRIRDVNQLVQLTGAEYTLLCEMRGRDLHRWLKKRFSLGHRAPSGNPIQRRWAA